MKILTRYLLRAHLGPFLFAFCALTGVILINTLARRLADLAGKGLPLDVVLKFFVLALPATVALTFPMAVLVSVLYTFSNFTAENEITAMKASGVDLKRLLLPLLTAAGIITVFMVWFNDRVLPEANHRWSQLFNDITRKTPTLILQEQTINRIQAGTGARTYYLRAARIEPGSNRLWDVVIFDMGNDLQARTIWADSGRAVFNANQTDLLIRLYDGHVREFRYDDPRTFTRIYFDEQTFGIPGVGNTLDITEGGGGYRGDRELTIGMLEGRVDTLARERRDLVRTVRRRASEDLDFALSGGRVRPAGEPALPGGGVDEGGVRFQTRRTAEELAGTLRRVEDVERQVREYEVEIHKKYSIAVASLVFVIVGAPLALRFGGGGIGMVIATSLMIFSLYYVGLIGGEVLADAGKVTPVVSMWGVNAAMTVVGCLGLLAMGRETSTARSSGWDTLVQALRDALAAPRARLQRRKAAA
ncbi:MAG TPA: LptF/LptG family permease [Longimicrobiaceae bacterium]|nr:LptF/LptG family permease [Longimicrobiaceae bacterium]